MWTTKYSSDANVRRYVFSRCDLHVHRRVSGWTRRNSLATQPVGLISNKSYSLLSIQTTPDWYDIYLWECILRTYEYVTYVLHMRTIVRIRNSYICVWVSHVEFHKCANNTKSSRLIKLQRKINTAGLCRPDVATDQIYTVCHLYHSKWCKAWSDVIIAIWQLIYHALMLLMLLFFGGFFCCCCFVVFCFITKTYLYNFDPLKPHFYIEKTGVYRGVHYFSYFCSKNRLWVLVRTASSRRF